MTTSFAKERHPGGEAGAGIQSMISCVLAASGRVATSTVFSGAFLAKLCDSFCRSSELPLD